MVEVTEGLNSRLPSAVFVHQKAHPTHASYKQLRATYATTKILLGLFCIRKYFPHCGPTPEKQLIGIHEFYVLVIICLILYLVLGMGKGRP